MSSVSALDFDIVPAVPARACELGIRATDPDGFDILVFSDERGTRVCFGGLEQDFDTPEEAALWVKRARSDAYRLRIDFLDKRPFRWALEEIVCGGDVREVLVSGCTVSQRLLHKRRIVYRQNHQFRRAR